MKLRFDLVWGWYNNTLMAVMASFPPTTRLAIFALLVPCFYCIFLFVLKWKKILDMTILFIMHVLIITFFNLLFYRILLFGPTRKKNLTIWPNLIWNWRLVNFFHLCMMVANLSKLIVCDFNISHSPFFESTEYRLSLHNCFLILSQFFL